MRPIGHLPKRSVVQTTATSAAARTGGIGSTVAVRDMVAREQLPNTAP